MGLERSELKQLLNRVIFDESEAEDWIQDVWGLSPMLGDSAAKLWDVLELLIDDCSDEMLEGFLQVIYQRYLEPENASIN
jgi:hypothetical protein